MPDEAARGSRPFLSRQERFESVASTNDIVRAWLADGTGELCVAVAAEQTAGRGRSGRSWVAPAGAALLMSLGFEPVYVAPDRLWRVAAIVALAMADAAEEVAGLPMTMLKLKWPNDIVVDAPDAPSGVRKLAGLLGETEGVGTAGVKAVVGIGTNADWPREQFPAELADSMTSLREASRGRPIDTDELLDAFLLRLEPRLLGLRDGHFDVAGWHDRQITTGRSVRIDMPAGATVTARAVGVDGASGALLIEDAEGRERELTVGEVTSVRLVGSPEAGGTGSRGVTP
jgi:BirA family transcriptional regulator, biotin operon repressor / biotin---[acetyl-CoA-carboxylase] ligase